MAVVSTLTAVVVAQLEIDGFFCATPRNIAGIPLRRRVAGSVALPEAEAEARGAVAMCCRAVGQAVHGTVGVGQAVQRL